MIVEVRYDDRFCLAKCEAVVVTHFNNHVIMYSAIM